MGNLQSLRIFFFVTFLCLIWVENVQATPDKISRGIRHKPDISLAPFAPRTRKIIKRNFSAQTKPIDFTKPLKACWSILNNKIEADKIASDNESKNNVKTANEYLFVPFLDGKVSAIDASTAERIWETHLGGKIISNLLVDDKNLYTLSKILYQDKAKNIDGVADSQIVIRSLNKKSGLTEWQANLNLANFVNEVKEVNTERKTEEKEAITANEIKNELDGNYQMAIFKSSLIIYGGAGFVISVSKNNGELRWRKNYGSLFPDSSLLANDYLVLKNSEGFLIVSADTGVVIESFKQPAETTNVFYQSDKRRITYGDNKGMIYSSILKNGTASVSWKFRNGAGIANISLTDTGFLISSLDNFLYMLSENNGELIWKKRLGGRIDFQPLIEGNYAIVTNASEPTASVIELQTGKIVNKIILESGDFFTGKPLKSGSKLLLTTQRGIFAFSDSDCLSIHN